MHSTIESIGNKVPPIKFYKAMNSDNISVKVMGKTEPTFHIEIIVVKSVPDNLNY